MSFIDMACKCGSALQLDGLDEDFIVLMTLRFAESHQVCGYIAPTVTDAPERRIRRSINLTNLHDEDE